MKRLLNTLYITSSDRYLSLDGENVVVLAEQKEVGRVPLHNLEAIVTFGFTGASPALMGACAQRNVALSFLSHSGRFLARISGEERGNVLLRKRQYGISEDAAGSLDIAKSFIIGKIFNARWVLERATRDHAMRVDTERLKKVSGQLKCSLESVQECAFVDTLRGIEGEAASLYFSVFDELILQQKEAFRFQGRNRRPPLDAINALLSFVYTLLTNMTASALETVGLDPYVGFMHTDRPGRASLALDLMEELRPVFADRFVLSLINKRIVSPSGFYQKENGAVMMDDDTRKAVLSAWQSRKQEAIRHPFLEEKVEWGMVPYSQALLLARFIRGDLDAYPPFLWK
ncbi:type I-C CRISPR-associated endonuclease Cas1c [uncultured Acetatifactor sp.]|uniref:type I-C CRISPR-associated endonuclease Cas1c n=1 Tax=uncultured Acetatifactor sp. TaxID=1671927 RepID=UPI002629015B|nr:type I-C CRISPR-associated endonuclease Cas1c [uncultured Acetatifactor sp.]